MSDPAVIFAGGGTGGHLYPALAILQALSRRANPEHLFICSNRPLDAEILTNEGVQHRAVPAAPFARKPLGLLRFMRSWAPSVREGRGVIRELSRKDRDVVVVAMGGFVAPPIVQAARVERVPRLLVNLDAVPGKANKWIARHATKVLSVQGAGGFDAIPPIVRDEARWSGPKAGARESLGLHPESPTLLITCGSQGARSVDAMMLLLPQLDWLHHALQGWQVLHQARPESVDILQRTYDAAQVPAVVLPYLDNIGAAWGAADLALARAGAGSVAEVWANRVPTIFVPYPGHTDEHQRQNARPLEEVGGALIATDAQSPAQNADDVGRTLANLLLDSSQRTRMQGALASLSPADGAEHAAIAILDQVA